MTNSNSQTETKSHTIGVAVGHGETTAEQIFDLPDISKLDVPALLALRTAIIARIQELQSTGVVALKEQFIDQARSLGITPEEVLGLAPGNKKPRGRKPKQKLAE